MEPMDWLEYVRSEKKKPFDKVQLCCEFPTDVIFADGFNAEQMFDLNALDPVADTIPQFSSDPETIVKQIVGYTILLRRVLVYKKALDKNYGVLASSLAGLLDKECSKQTADMFECNKLVKQIRDYATAIANREHNEEELMDSKRIEDEIKGLEDISDDGNTHK